MTKQELKQKIAIVQDNAQDLIDAKINSLINSGAIDLESYENDFTLPKVVMTVVYDYLKDQVYPYGNNARKEVKNLLKF